MDASSPQFDFGQNWLEFSRVALTPARIEAASREFTQLHDGVPLSGRNFLEIGFGQGLSLLFAQQAGARVVGCDINPKCAEALAVTRGYFPGRAYELPLVVGSILEPSVVERLRSASPSSDGLYDVVHSWGVLHHTGEMDLAINQAAHLVAPGGHLVIAIYNRHWSSQTWLWIKWIYVRSPRWLQKLFIVTLLPVIYMAKWIVTGKDPKKQERGMDFYYNVIDWVGGYPYEYASRAELESKLSTLGFRITKFVAARVPTGCNEFVFRRTGNHPAK